MFQFFYICNRLVIPLRWEVFFSYWLINEQALSLSFRAFSETCPQWSHSLCPVKFFSQQEAFHQGNHFFFFHFHNPTLPTVERIHETTSEQNLLPISSKSLSFQYLTIAGRHLKIVTSYKSNQWVVIHIRDRNSPKKWRWWIQSLKVPIRHLLIEKDPNEAYWKMGDVLMNPLRQAVIQAMAHHERGVLFLHQSLTIIYWNEVEFS